MPFKRFVEAGRVALIKGTRYNGKLCTILDVIDQNRALIEGPKTGVPRQEIRFPNLYLTKFTIGIPHNAPTRVVRQAWEKKNVLAVWKKTRWYKRMERAKVRRCLGDLDRFKLREYMRKRNKVVSKRYKELYKADCQYREKLKQENKDKKGYNRRVKKTPKEIALANSLRKKNNLQELKLAKRRKAKLLRYRKEKAAKLAEKKAKREEVDKEAAAAAKKAALKAKKEETRKAIEEKQKIRSDKRKAKIAKKIAEGKLAKKKHRAFVGKPTSIKNKQKVLKERIAALKLRIKKQDTKRAEEKKAKAAKKPREIKKRERFDPKKLSSAGKKPKAVKGKTPEKPKVEEKKEAPK